MDPPTVARRLFAPIAPSYERWASILSMGQDARWRQALVTLLDPPTGASTLDVAAGTGSITRLLDDRGCRVIALDQSLAMLARHRGGLGVPVAATAERLPFPDGSFDVVTFGYLLRYVDDVPGALAELARVVRSGGQLGMVEFGLPTGVWRPLWWLYTRTVLPISGALIGSGWGKVGQFLGHSIEGFARTWPPERLAATWESAGLDEVGFRRLSLGGGLVMWGRKA
ncbi:MAG TPA: class I SAM-dependent methyltransferase [Acidimicrobiia bacterium]|nr:class I SAM-dependent methyltransferase [Acidimicrobiia bacterium]